jgi:hypothetical protein
VIRTVTAVAVECDHYDDDSDPSSRCESVLNLRVTDPVEISTAEVRVGAAARGWHVDDGEHCPKHRPTTEAAPTAQSGAHP